MQIGTAVKISWDAHVANRVLGCCGVVSFLSRRIDWFYPHEQHLHAFVKFDAPIRRGTVGELRGLWVNVDYLEERDN